MPSAGRPAAIRPVGCILGYKGVHEAHPTGSATASTPSSSIDCESVRVMRSRVPFLSIAWSLLVTIARAIRRPNDFAEAHWLLDYQFGFVKRGLIGSLYSLVHSTL